MKKLLLRKILNTFFKKLKKRFIAIFEPKYRKKHLKKISNFFEIWSTPTF